MFDWKSLLFLLVALVSVQVTAQSHLLEWESDSPKSLLHVIYPDSKSQRIEVQGHSYELPIDQKGTYRWRVKSLKGINQSRYSAWAELEVEDSILEWKESLMVSPGNHEKIKDNHTFKIKRPNPQWTYQVEVLQDGKKIWKKSVESEDFSVDLSEADREKALSWDVKAESKLGHSFTSPAQNFSLQKFSQNCFSYEFMPSTVDISFKSYDQSHTLLTHALRYARKRDSQWLQEYWGQIRYARPVSDQEYQSLEFAGGIRYQSWLLEAEHTRLTYDLARNIKANQSLSFLDVGYQFYYPEFSKDLRTDLLFKKSLDSEMTASFKLRSFYNINRDFYLRLEVNYNQTRPRISFPGDDAKSTQRLIQAGLGIGYRFY